MVDDFVEPNGIAFSPDEKKLYVIDTGFTDGPNNPSHLRVFDVDLEGGKVSNGKVFADMPKPSISDGVRTDTAGNVWCSVGWGDAERNGVRCYNAGGDLLGKSPHPGDGRQSVLRRHLQKPAVYLRLELALRGLYQRDRRLEAVTRLPALAPI